VRTFLCVLAVCGTVAGCASAQDKAGSSGRPATAGRTMNGGNELVCRHPASEALMRFFAGEQRAGEPSFESTGLTRQDYLKLIAGEVDFWKQHLNAAGAIIDPYSTNPKTGEHLERQYSTPAFALSSAILVRDAGRTDLLEPSTRAMTFALTALARKTTADNHADFYIPMLVHARRLLAEKAKKEQVAQWDELFQSLVPEKTYRDPEGRANWNIVNLSGEMMRRKDKLVATTQASPQMEYIERCLTTQRARFTKYGMYEDPNSPIAYDAFPRCWLEDATADGAYDGKYKDELNDWLALGSLSSLLLISPSGEWTSSGRSAHHQWNEAENALILEIEAVKWKTRGRDDIAGACKRAAHLCLTSMQRWVRPSGEMWVVKNRFDPERRFGYEGYSFHSQYNLLPMGMLTIAYLRADDSIKERPAPSEAGSYVFDLRDVFQNAVAACGGTFVVVNTGADPAYNATGLQRIHRKGVALSPLTDSVGGKSHYGGGSRGEHDLPPIVMSPGIEWREREGANVATRTTGGANAAENSGDETTPAPATRSAADQGWHSLADFVRGEQDGAAKPYGPSIVIAADLHVVEQSPQRIAFTLRYALDGPGARLLEEDYTITADAVEQTARLPVPRGTTAPTATRVAVPVLVNDGQRDFATLISGDRFTTRRPGGALTVQVVAPAGVQLKQSGESTASHNGVVQSVTAELPKAAREVRLRYQLVPEPEKP
jgi:hypothetical protein